MPEKSASRLTKPPYVSELDSPNPTSSDKLNSSYPTKVLPGNQSASTIFWTKNKQLVKPQ